MNDLIVRRTPSTELPALAQFHPLRSLREMLSWDPFQEMAPLLPLDLHRVIPPFEVREAKDRFVFMADLPGVEAKDIEILLTGNRLTISGTRIDKVEKGDEGDYYARERSYGTFTRSFTLPEGADLSAVQAHLDRRCAHHRVPQGPRGAAEEDPRDGGEGLEGLAVRFKP
jgi:HSP20 family protein